MDLLQLRYFIAVAETEHVTHAAESLNVAQPALTKTIKKLEKEIGFPLFERKGRGITLSKCGKYLYDYVAEAVKVIERAPGAVARFASDIKDVVKLNVLAASDCVTTAIIDYKKSHACDVVFSVVQNNAISDADIAIYTDTKRANGADVANFCEDIMLAVPEKKDYSGLKKSNSTRSGTKVSCAFKATRVFVRFATTCVARQDLSPISPLKATTPAPCGTLLRKGTAWDSGRDIPGATSARESSC